MKYSKNGNFLVIDREDGNLSVEMTRDEIGQLLNQALSGECELDADSKASLDNSIKKLNDLLSQCDSLGIVIEPEQSNELKLISSISNIVGA